jgi:hypothetical protein
MTPPVAPRFLNAKYLEFYEIAMLLVIGGGIATLLIVSGMAAVAIGASLYA